MEANMTTDNNALCQIEVDEMDRYVAAAFAPGATRSARQYLRTFVALDTSYTKLRYTMMLLIIIGIDTNGNILPLAWALVPTENEEWWTWFCNFVKEAFQPLSEKGPVFMSDCNKGLTAGISTTFPQGCAAHYCQHIADNI
jgi:transposase-like protein